MPLHLQDGIGQTVVRSITVTPATPLIACGNCAPTLASVAHNLRKLRLKVSVLHVMVTICLVLIPCLAVACMFVIRRKHLWPPARLVPHMLLSSMRSLPTTVDPVAPSSVAFHAFRMLNHAAWSVSKVVCLAPKIVPVALTQLLTRCAHIALVNRFSALTQQQISPVFQWTRQQLHRTVTLPCCPSSPPKVLLFRKVFKKGFVQSALA